MRWLLLLACILVGCDAEDDAPAPDDEGADAVVADGTAPSTGLDAQTDAGERCPHGYADNEFCVCPPDTNDGDPCNGQDVCLNNFTYESRPCADEQDTYANYYACVDGAWRFERNDVVGFMVDCPIEFYQDAGPDAS